MTTVLTRGRRDQLVIHDDPAFELDFQLPAFSLDDDGNVLIAQTSNTQNSSSQMSPHTADGSSRSQHSPFEAFNISASPGGSGLHQLEMPFGRDSILSEKLRDGGLGNIADGEEDQLVMDDDWGIRIDDEGNVVLADEQQLPQLPPLHSDPAAANTQQNAPAPAAPEPDEMIIDAGDDILPDAEAFPQRRSDQVTAQESSSAAAAPVRRQRRKPLICPDETTMLTTAQIRAWSKDYGERSDAARKTPRATTQAQARRTAYELTFGFGIAHVGAPTSIPGLVHPLAQFFAGAALERSVLGVTLQPPPGDDTPHGHRRTSGEAFGGDADPSRRVRPRLSDTPQAGRGAEPSHEDDPAMFDPGLDLELGREAPGSALRSDVSAPWNRPGSVHGSSARGSAVKVSGPGHQVSASPLHGRGGPAAIERLSSDLPMPFGSDDFGPPDHPSSLRGEEQAKTQMQAALDEEGLRFLDFIGTRARDKGEARGDGRTWVDFDTLFEPPDATKLVVTQAFFHVLALATRDVIKVEQDDAMETPFGPIRLGVLAGEAADVFGEEDVAAE